MANQHASPLDRPRVLLVEDRAGVRAGVARALQDDGCEVLEAHDARAAMMLVACLNLPIALLITNHRLAQHGGEALVEGLARYDRAPPVLFVSNPDTGTLSPSNLEALCRRVREVTGTPGTGVFDKQHTA